ncbi:forkhead box protein N3-like isoform X2 [Cimex lectularius]|uniref:Fork-head domain-containing protein n=1 Tax=Cimex lectularius TaxID=79782 RepID=A0A8I6SQP5_CIMLE|nr:forkhead box protein N3-like isoform X2 [Cimex lectularius]
MRLFKGEMAPERGASLAEDSTGVTPAHGPRSPQSLLHIKEGDGAIEAAAMVERSEDDDLTSLSWLQDKNLLKGMNLRTGANGTPGGQANGTAGQVLKQESPTSDYTEDCPSEQSESTCSSVTSSSPVPAAPGPPAHSSPNFPQAVKNKHPHHIPYDPKIHITSKPPYSFSCLIFMSIEDSKGKALPVKEIYTWILDHFPYYRNAPTGWKNSVRHNLSLNKCFRKVDKAPNLGKGSLWMVDPVSRPKLVEALMKAPYHPYTNLDKSNSAPHLRKRSPSPECADTGSLDELDDVDAAAAMLVLKHGPHARLHISHSREEYHKKHRMALQQGLTNGKWPREDECVQARPIEDHNYSTLEGGTEQNSADEAFADGSDSNSSGSLRIYEDADLEERRKTAEGADALLNLAGIKTAVTVLPPAKRIRTLSPAQPMTPLSHNNNTSIPAKLRRKPVCPQRMKAKR